MSVLGYLVMDGIFGSMNLSPVVFDHCHDYLSRYLIFTIPILLMNNFTLLYDRRREVRSFYGLLHYRRRVEYGP